MGMVLNMLIRQAFSHVIPGNEEIKSILMCWWRKDYDHLSTGRDISAGCHNNFHIFAKVYEQ
jgi:hypothetical protein